MIYYNMKMFISQIHAKKEENKGTLFFPTFMLWKSAFTFCFLVFLTRYDNFFFDLQIFWKSQEVSVNSVKQFKCNNQSLKTVTLSFFPQRHG